MRRLLVAAAAVLATVTLFASTASATVMTYNDLDRMVEISDVIVHGTVVEQHTYMDKEQERVVTDTTLEVERNFYGASSQEITFQQWGGEYEGEIHRIPGDAQFQEGEEVILFLHEGDGVLAPSALGQSKYQVRELGDDGKIASRDFSDIELLIEQPDGSKRMFEMPEETRSFESLTAELETLVAGIKQTEPQLPSGGDETHE
ncbi:MAG: hypothetical protein ACOCV2_06845 [Persicimonas sp.]